MRNYNSRLLLEDHIAIGNFAKFGGGIAIHHNRNMLEKFLSVCITLRLIKGVGLMFPKLDQNPPHFALLMM
jgi:hypothetical protein